MTIDISHEHLLTMAEASRLLPGRPSTATLYRWRTRGVGGIRLASITCGGKVYTSREAMQRFVDAQTAAATGEPIPTRTARQRDRAVDAAERELERAGA